MAQVAADMLMLLCDHVDVLLAQQPETPRRIIEVICNVIANLLPSTENSNSEEDKRVRPPSVMCSEAADVSTTGIDLMHNFGFVVCSCSFL